MNFRTVRIRISIYTWFNIYMIQWFKHISRVQPTNTKKRVKKKNQTHKQKKSFNKEMDYLVFHEQKLRLIGRAFQWGKVARVFGWVCGFRGKSWGRRILVWTRNLVEDEELRVQRKNQSKELRVSLWWVWTTESG